MMALLSSCADSETTPVSESLNQEGVYSTKLSVAEALNRADALFDEISNGSRSANREIESVEILTSEPSTRAEGVSDTLLYLVNYTNNQGYVLLGSDIRMPDVYAISDSGHLDRESIDGNEMLSDFVENAKAHAQSKTAGLEPVYPIIDYTYRYVAKNNTGKLVNLNVAQWNQYSPYNKYCFTSYGTQSCPGCLPVATGMVMSYLNWPETVSNTSINWNAIVHGNDKDAAAKFLSLIGPSFNVTYEAGAAFCYNYYVASGYKKLGFNIENSYFEIPVKGNSHKILALLKGYADNNVPRQPVLITGTHSLGVGHAFVIDGMIERVQEVYINNKLHITTPMVPLYHILWGWNTNGINYDGYFLYYPDEDLFSDESVGLDSMPDGESEMPIGGNAFTNLTIRSGLIPLK